MADVTIAQTNFTAGELSPRLAGRTDIAQYFNGLRTAKNFIPQKHGPVTKRPGTKHANEVKDSANLTILVEFQYSLTQTYILEFGNLYVRFYRNSGQLEVSPGVPTEKTTPWTSSQLRALKFVQSADRLFVNHPDVMPHRISRVAGDDSANATWKVQKHPQAEAPDGPYLALNRESTTLKVTSAGGPFAEGDSITIVASAVTGINDDQGFLSTDGPSTNNFGRVITLSMEEVEDWAPVQITAVNSTTEVVATVLKRPLNLATDEVTTRWRLGAWSDTTGWPHVSTIHQERIWSGATKTEPQTVWATKIGTLSGYRPHDPNEIAPEAEDALTATMGNSDVNTIRWLESDDEGILILASAGEFVGGTGGGGFEVVDALAFSISRHSAHGSHATARPHRVGSTLVFVHAAGRRLRQLAFATLSNTFEAPDLTLLSEHITKGGIIDTAYQQEPDPIVWSVRNDGVLLGLTNERPQEVVAWHRHILGGTLSGSDQPEVESIAVIREDSKDQLWMIVKRTINGATRRYVEIMQPVFDVDSHTEADAFFVDSGATLDNRQNITGASQANPVVITSASHGYENGDTVRIRDVKGMIELNGNVYTVASAGTNDFNLTDSSGNNIDGTGFNAYDSGGTVAKQQSTVSGLDHLEGQTVAIAADGAHHASKTVEGGTVILDTPASIAHVGLGYASIAETMPLVFVRGRIDTRGRRKRVIRAHVRVSRSMGGSAGVNRMDPFVLPDEFKTTDHPLDLFSGLFTVSPDAETALDQTFTIEHDTPTPFTLLEIISEVEVVGI